jgi:hypothetical protein
MADSCAFADGAIATTEGIQKARLRINVVTWRIYLNSYEFLLYDIFVFTVFEDITEVIQNCFQLHFWQHPINDVPKSYENFKLVQIDLDYFLN